MAITTEDHLVDMVANARPYSYLKVLTAPKAAGAFQSAWMAAGRPGAGVASPVYTAGSGYTCSSATTGALAQANGSVQNWLARATATAGVVGTLLVYDRLWSCSGMGFAASTYAVTTPSTLPARITDSGVGVEAWIENFVAAGAASGTATLTYVNTVPTSARTGVIAAVVSAPVAGQMQPFPLQAGDVGISQVTNVITSATWTSGSFGVTLMKKIAEIPVGLAGVSQLFDWSDVVTKIPADACIQLVWQANSTTAPTVNGTLWVGDK